MFVTSSLLLLIFIFLFASVIVWIAGNELSYATEIIDKRFKIGQALGGLIFLSITTNLPEIAVVISAALTSKISLAIGNILGGIAIRTVVLAFLDGVGLRNKSALTAKAASLQLVLEGVLVVAILTIAIMGTQLPATPLLFHLTADNLLLAITWIVGIWLVNKARKGLRWHEKGQAPHTSRPRKLRQQIRMEKWSTLRLLTMFLLASIFTLGAGVLLEESSSVIATRIGWDGVIFGATILAAATSLPEISTGLAAIKIGDYTLAVSEIFGGNAFLPMLFIPATLISGQTILPQAQNTDIYLASLAILLTCIYIYGLIFRPQRQFFYLGIDSILVLIVYVIGMIGLFTMTGFR